MTLVNHQNRRQLMTWNSQARISLPYHNLERPRPDGSVLLGVGNDMISRDAKRRCCMLQTLPYFPTSARRRSGENSSF